MVAEFPRNTSTLGNTVQWIFCDVEWDIDLILQTLVETTEQSTTTREPDTILHDIGIELRRCVLQCAEWSTKIVKPQAKIVKPQYESGFDSQ